MTEFDDVIRLLEKADRRHDLELDKIKQRIRAGRRQHLQGGSSR